MYPPFGKQVRRDSRNAEAPGSH